MEDEKKVEDLDKKDETSESKSDEKADEKPPEKKEENGEESKSSEDSKPPEKVEEVEEEVEEVDASAGVEELKSAVKERDKKIKELEGVIKGLVDESLASLSEDDRKLVQDLAGNSPAAQLNTFNRLKAGGKIGAKQEETKEAPPADRTRISSSEAPDAKPKTWEEADASFSKKVRRLKTKK